jgi:excisionase family DNA binding protein
MVEKKQIVDTIFEDLPTRPLSPNELAEFVGTSRRFIEEQVRHGKLRARKISPRAVRFFRSDIAAWLAKTASVEVEA